LKSASVTGISVMILFSPRYPQIVENQGLDTNMLGS